MEKIIYRAQDPYPEVTSCGTNAHDLQLVCPLYSGTLSELSGITQYVYQHLVLKSQCDEISEIILGIAKVEMHHLDMLGEAIVAMGGDPRYVNPNIHCWWNASAVGYEKSMCKALLLNLSQETEAHKAYLCAAEKAKNSSLAALLRRIAADEKCHMEIFTSLINCHCRNK